MHTAHPYPAIPLFLKQYFDKHPENQSGLTENIQKKIKGYNSTPMLYNFEKQQNVRKYMSSRKHKQM